MPKKRKRKGSSSAPPLLVKGVTAASLAKAAAAAATQSNKRRSRRNISNTKTTPKRNTNRSLDESFSFSSTAESLAFISDYHTLNKRLEQNERDTTLTQAQRRKNAHDLHQQQQAMGGLERYQKASIFGAKSSQFVCADWVVPLLRQKTKQHNKATTQPPKQKKLRILDVGAIDNQYCGKGRHDDDWLEVVPIDLQGGQHESVLQVDFFDYAHDYCRGQDLAVAQRLPSSTTTTPQSSSPTPTTTTPPQPFDAIVMSLVLNFQGDPRLRGDMLALAADPRLLKPPPSRKNNDDDYFPGMLFVALPLASLENSRYCDMERFIQVVTNPLFHLDLVETKRSSKLILFAFQRKTKKDDEDDEDIIIEEDDDTKSKSKKKNHPRQQRKLKQPNYYYYNVRDKTFDYGSHEMKRLQPPKPGAKRNNFAVILKSSHNRETAAP